MARASFSGAGPEDVRNVVLYQVACGAPGADYRADQRHRHNKTKLHPREEEEQWNLREHDLLQNHSEGDTAPNHHAEQAARDHKDECLVEVENLDPKLSKAHRSQHPDLLGLVHQVRAHARRQGEQTKEHRDHNNDTEDEVENQHDLRHRVVLVKLVDEPDAVCLFRVELLFAVSYKVFGRVHVVVAATFVLEFYEEVAPPCLVHRSERTDQVVELGDVNEEILIAFHVSVPHEEVGDLICSPKHSLFEVSGLETVAGRFHR